MLGFCYANQKTWTLHYYVYATTNDRGCDGRAASCELDVPDFVQRPLEGRIALLTEPLQSCDHPYGRFNFEVQCPVLWHPEGSVGAS